MRLLPAYSDHSRLVPHSPSTDYYLKISFHFNLIHRNENGICGMYYGQEDGIRTNAKESYREQS